MNLIAQGAQKFQHLLMFPIVIGQYTNSGRAPENITFYLADPDSKA
jgi:hypothetical protein